MGFAVLACSLKICFQTNITIKVTVFLTRTVKITYLQTILPEKLPRVLFFIIERDILLLREKGEGRERKGGGEEREREAKEYGLARIASWGVN